MALYPLNPTSLPSCPLKKRDQVEEAVERKPNRELTELGMEDHEYRWAKVAAAAWLAADTAAVPIRCQPLQVVAVRWEQ